MKCPKCGFMSFDFNLSCPACKKDISAEQQKLHFPSFRPDPPSLLGALLGQANESNVGIHMDASTEVAAMHEGPELGMDESAVLETGEVTLEDSQEVDLGLDLESVGEEEAGGEEISLEEPVADFDLEGAPAEEITAEAQTPAGEPEGVLSLEGEEEPGEISLDLGDLASETPGQEEKVILETLQKEEQKLAADLGDFSLEEAGSEAPAGEGLKLDDAGEISLDLDSIASEADMVPKEEEKGEISLNLEDLKVNETGELEIGKAAASLESSKKPSEIEGLSLDLESEGSGEVAKAEEDFTLLLDDDDTKKPAGSDEGEAVIDLENLDLELDLEKPKK